jgi:hypothetical protein
MRVHRDPRSNLTLEELAHNRMVKAAIGVGWLVIVLVFFVMLVLPGMEGPPGWFWTGSGIGAWAVFRLMDWWWPS